jgi:uncharacterized PurR-regulated membrane protein YhhQ (DUF165 family)
MLRTKVTVRTLKRNTMSSIVSHCTVIEKRGYIDYFLFFFSMILISANFVGDHTLQLFYFTCSSGTLLIQLVFCGVIFLTETVGYRKTNAIIGYSAAINLIIALFIYYGLALPIPEFWVKDDAENIENWQQFAIVLMFTLSYLLSAKWLVKVGGFLKVKLGKDWLLLRVSLLLLGVLVLDMMVLTPVFYWVSGDSYLALWKMLSLVSVKIWLSLCTIPIAYLLVKFRGKITRRY